MAEKKSMVDILSQDKIGTYTESTGGGTPLEKGEKLKDHPEAHRVQQPRDEEGKFTYNSANAKELKYGPSRGTTIPPFLRGVSIDFAIKKGDVVIDAEGKRWVSEINISAGELFNRLKNYIEGKGFGGKLEGEMSRKRGRTSGQERSKIDAKVVGQIFNTAQKISPEVFAGRKDAIGNIIKMADQEVFLSNLTKQIKANKIAMQENIKKYKGPEGQKLPFSLRRREGEEDEGERNNPVETKDDSYSSNGAFNIDNIKSNPRDFLTNNEKNFEEIVNIVEQKNPQANRKDTFKEIFEGITSGKYKSFDEIKEHYSKD